jgi:hypothetical protein
VIDALLQQACAHLISHCLRSSSRLFRSEVAHAFAHDQSIFIWRAMSARHRRCFFCCTYQLLSITQIILCIILSLNQRHRERKGCAQRLYSLRLRTPSDADVRIATFRWVDVVSKHKHLCVMYDCRSVGMQTCELSNCQTGDRWTWTCTFVLVFLLYRSRP